MGSGEKETVASQPKPSHIPAPTVAKNLNFARKEARLGPNLLEKGLNLAILG